MSLESFELGIKDALNFRKKVRENKKPVYQMSQDNFQWTDELVKEFWNRYRLSGPGGIYSYFKQFKEEKTKRDWEILEFTAKYWGSNNVRFSRGYDGTYSAGINGVIATEPIEKLKANGVIHSVKRLSDGEVFSIGDEVEYSISGEKFDGKIDSFDVWQDSIMALGEPLSFRINLKHLQKVVKPKPLFVTEDGKEIFEDDYYYSVGKEYNRTGTSRGLTWYNPISGDKYFSTAEAAVEFIIINKPVLSVKDVMGVFRNFFENDKISNPTHGMIRKALKQLAKEKLSE